MVGGMGVRKNIHIENWASFRENCEHYFRFSKANWARFITFGIGVPLVIYYGVVTDMSTNAQGPERLSYEPRYLGGPKKQ